MHRRQKLIVFFSHLQSGTVSIVIARAGAWCLYLGDTWEHMCSYVRPKQTHNKLPVHSMRPELRMLRCDAALGQCWGCCNAEEVLERVGSIFFLCLGCILHVVN